LCFRAKGGDRRYCDDCEVIVYSIREIDRLAAVMELHTWTT
jgi:hypothetical protein